MGYFLTELNKLLPQLGVTFVGVFLAFLLDRAIDWHKRKQKIKDLLRDLREELEESRDKLTGNANLHFPDIWKSAISSGQIRLLNSEQVTQLARVYRDIQAIEYNAKWVKQAREDFVAAGHPTRRTLLKDRWKKYSKIQREREENLRKEIESILREKWWGV